MQNVYDDLKELAAFRKKVRAFFDARAFIEVQTPVMVKTPGVEKHLQYFETHWSHPKFGRKELFLRSSPEVALKYLLAKGAKAIYEIGSCMRQGEEYGPWHRPEFTMLEFYQSPWSYEEFLTCCQKLVDHLVERQAGSGWHRITMQEAFLEFTGLELIDQDPGLAAQAIAKNIVSVKKDDCFEDAFFKVLIDKVEPKLKSMGKVILEKYPASQSALSKRVTEQTGSYAARFEVYVDGIELGNCFLEEDSAKHIAARVQEVNDFRGQSQSTDSVLTALCKDGIPQACGAAFGVDRLFAMHMGNAEELHSLASLFEG